MADRSQTSPNSEETGAGTQSLIDGVRPLTVRDRLAVLATRPLGPKRPCPQRPCDLGLFDEDTRNQMELF